MGWTVTRNDLTNTYFEGEAAANPKARWGHSKGKRSDCPLVTLGLIPDGSGFVRRSQVFDDNAVEGETLEGMLQGLGAARGALVAMVRGIATEDNLWERIGRLKEQSHGVGQHYRIEIVPDPSGEKAQAIRWATRRETLAGQCRVTATFRRPDGRALHVRKATRAEPAQLAIIQALGSGIGRVQRVGPELAVDIDRTLAQHADMHAHEVPAFLRDPTHAAGIGETGRDCRQDPVELATWASSCAKTALPDGIRGCSIPPSTPCLPTV